MLSLSLGQQNIALHYKNRNWLLRSSYETGTYIVKQQPLVDAEKILMPPLHIKLGLIKQVAKQLDTEGEAFKYIQQLFPKLSESKIEAGVFVGPEVKRLINSIDFPELLSEVEQTAWMCFESVVNGFLGKHRAKNFKKLVDGPVEAYRKMGCKMSLKVHVLHAHLDEFKDNMGDYSEEQGERFHQDVRSFEEHYKGQYNKSMNGGLHMEHFAQK